MSKASPSSMQRAEEQRLATLRGLGILDTPAEPEFDELARLAASALRATSAAISLIDSSRQWFKARHDIPFPETPRDIAFCDHAVTTRAMLVVPDARLDPRFSDNPLVRADNGVRFYAGVPLIAGSGHCLGTLCVLDPAPRGGLSPQEATVLHDLARMVVNRIESRHRRRLGRIAAKVVEASSDAVVAANAEGRILYWNPAAERIFGFTPEQAIGRSIDILLADSGIKDIALLRLAARASSPLAGTVEIEGSHVDGTRRPLELSLAKWGVDEGEHGFAAIVRDIGARKTLEKEREQARSFLDTVITNLPAMLFVKDVQSRKYLMVNRTGAEVIGRDAADMIGRTDGELFPDVGWRYEERDTRAIAAGVPQVFESEFLRDDGRSVHLRTTRVLVDGPDRSDQYILGMSEDVTQVRQAQAAILQLAQHDPLTGLLNRGSYADSLHRAVTAGAAFAMLAVDLNRFKAVNDQFGHLVGDGVLVEVGRRLRSLVNDGDCIARIGGDEFVIILTDTDPRRRAERLAASIVEQVAVPFQTDRAVAHTGASIGVVIFPEDGTTTAQLRENVDLALYRAKQRAHTGICFFHAQMDVAANDRRKLETDLRAAIEVDAIMLAYQPVVSVATGQVTSVEALARWTHPERGPVPPAAFIPLAEESGMIDQLGQQILMRACADALGWPSRIKVAVNLSPLQFLSGTLIETLKQALAETGLDPERLQLEVTEGLVIRDVDRTFAQLDQIRASGIQVLIDDFGVGYSSLSYFKRFRFDAVKLDKSFVDDVARSNAARAIIQAVVGLGKQLGMAIVAEGVETEEQMQKLVELGCTHLQGYLFSRPMSAQLFGEFVNGGTREMPGARAINVVGNAA